MDQTVEPSDPKPPRSAFDDLCGRARKFCKSEDAKALLLAVGIVAFFAGSALYNEYRSGPDTSVPACDDTSCSDPLANLPSAPGNPDAPPSIGAVQNDDPDRQPAFNAERQRRLARSARLNLPPGVVMSRKTGARARVGFAHAARFQAYIDDLETNHGARILFMGGIRPGQCRSSSMHPCGKALDVCQTRRGGVDSRCNLPARRALAQIAASHGLFEGGRWCDSDYGHAQVGVSAGDCGERWPRTVRRTVAPEARAGTGAAAVSFE